MESAAMKSLSDVITLMTLFSAASSDVIIPDSVSLQATQLVHYENKGTWYEANRVCKHQRGGHLVLVDGPYMADKLQQLSNNVGSFKSVYTRMVRHGDKQFYSHDAACNLVNTSSWVWKNPSDSEWDFQKQCVLADETTFRWKKADCGHKYEFVCEYPEKDACGFRLTSVSLASVPVANASTAVCQFTCQQMIGCFATAPSGHATLPPFTHCLFVVTGDDSNPMATLDDCPDLYESDDTTEPSDYNASGSSSSEGDDTNDCVPSSVPAQDLGQQSLMEFLLEANVSVDCTQTLILPTPVVETAYITLTPDVLTAFVTLTPDVVIDYVTLTPDAQFNYVTLTPDAVTTYAAVTPEVETVYVTASPGVQTAYVSVPAEVHTVYVTVTPSLPAQYVITTTVEQLLTVTVGGSCSSEEMAPVTPAAVSLPHTHIHTHNHNHIQTQTHIKTQTHTATVTATATVTSTVCPPQHSASACPNVTTTTTTTTKDSDSHPNHRVDDKAESDVLWEMQSVVKELTVNPSNVSRSRRKKESAPDERASAQTMGIAAILMMVLPVALVTLLDLPSLYRDILRLHSHAAAQDKP